MPTYAFTTMRHLSPEQRGMLVKSVTAIHQVEAKAPRYFVQVIFYTIEPGSMYIGGEAASEDHIWVRADIRAGRTREQKAAILHRIIRETVKILGVATESVWVYISDIPAAGVAEFGNVLPQPGGEAEWLASLPSALREKLLAAS
ncbi:4-oxalocrotonate tautomerase [Methylobacterium fujisawaense]|uniref:tautomerase family protein n=1 Tax=Methylobacterium fujisawaense TaxID=107400 RepID=UPI002F310D7D